MTSEQKIIITLVPGIADARMSVLDFVVLPGVRVAPGSVSEPISFKKYFINLNLC